MNIPGYPVPKRKLKTAVPLHFERDRGIELPLRQSLPQDLIYLHLFEEE